jgi:hypothetical protein
MRIQDYKSLVKIIYNITCFDSFKQNNLSSQTLDIC